jgi:hypothetical protein
VLLLRLYHVGRQADGGLVVEIWKNGRKIKMWRMEDGKYEGGNQRNMGRKNEQRKNGKGKKT